MPTSAVCMWLERGEHRLGGRKRCGGTAVRDSQRAKGLFGARELVAIFRRPDSVALVWKQAFTKQPGEFVAEMVWVERQGRDLVDYVMVG